jgi:hypothetical protein
LLELTKFDSAEINGIEKFSPAAAANKIISASGAQTNGGRAPVSSLLLKMSKITETPS